MSSKNSTNVPPIINLHGFVWGYVALSPVTTETSEQLFCIYNGSFDSQITTKNMNALIWSASFRELLET